MTSYRQVFIDTETTGLSAPKGDRIIEFAAIEAIDRQLTGRILHFHFDPQRPIGAGATRVHGFTEGMLRGKPLFASIATELLEFVRGAEVIMHNAAFDGGFIDAELERAGLHSRLSDVCKITCTMQKARTKYPDESVGLDALIERAHLGVVRGRHSALEDARLLSRIYYSCLNPAEAPARSASTRQQISDPPRDRTSPMLTPDHFGMEKAIELTGALRETFFYRAKHKRIIKHQVVSQKRWEKIAGPLLYAVTDHAGVIRYIGKWVSQTALYSRWIRHNTIHHQESARNLYIKELDDGRGPLAVWSISIEEIRHQLPEAIRDCPGKQLAEDLEAFLIRHGREQLIWNRKEESLTSAFPSKAVAVCFGMVDAQF